jgi:hypothetical protein
MVRLKRYGMGEVGARREGEKERNEEREGELEMGKEKLHIFEVGIMSDAAKIEAPTAEAAAIFYGLNTGGNMTLGAVVYTMDGEEYKGDSTPFLKWQFAQKLDDELKEKMETVKPLLKSCRFVEEAS